MSTRCQIQVTGESHKLTLYHHTDGYPSNMIPLIQKAFELSGGGWESGRTYKVASYLCASDPGIMEPLDYHDLHGDIEYLYQIWLVSPDGQHVGVKPTWDIQVLIPGHHGFWDDPKIEGMTVAIKRKRLDEITGKELSL